MTTTQTDEIKTWQQRLEETCPAIGPMHIHACVEEVNDAMQVEIDDLRAALQEQARETVTCECGRTHKSTSYGWASNEPAQPDHIADTNKMVPADHVEQHLDMVEQPEQGERAAQKAESLKNLTQWLDGLGGAIHTYSLRGIALHGFEKGWDAALQSAQPEQGPST